MMTPPCCIPLGTPSTDHVTANHQPGQAPYSSPGSPASIFGAAAGGGEVTTVFDQRGFPVVITVTPGATTLPRVYNEQGFLVTPTPAANAGILGQGEYTALKATSKAMAPGGARSRDDSVLVSALSWLVGSVVLFLL